MALNIHDLMRLGFSFSGGGRSAIPPPPQGSPVPMPPPPVQPVSSPVGAPPPMRTFYDSIDAVAPAPDLAFLPGGMWGGFPGGMPPPGPPGASTPPIVEPPTGDVGFSRPAPKWSMDPALSRFLLAAGARMMSAPPGHIAVGDAVESGLGAARDYQQDKRAERQQDKYQEYIDWQMKSGERDEAAGKKDAEQRAAAWEAEVEARRRYVEENVTDEDERRRLLGSIERDRGPFMRGMDSEWWEAATGATGEGEFKDHKFKDSVVRVYEDGRSEVVYRSQGTTGSAPGGGEMTPADREKWLNNRTKEIIDYMEDNVDWEEAAGRMGFHVDPEDPMSLRNAARIIAEREFAGMGGGGSNPPPPMSAEDMATLRQQVSQARGRNIPDGEIEQYLKRKGVHPAIIESAMRK